MPGVTRCGSLEEFPSDPEHCPFRVADICTCEEGRCVEIEWMEEDELEVATLPRR